MIYLIGGAPRAGKSILGQRVAASLRTSWISTDVLLEVLRVKPDKNMKTTWDGSPEAICSNNEWFFPYLERFIWGVNSLAENYLIEGVDFFPEQAAKLSSQYPIRAIFLGCTQMTLESFDRFPGRSQGYHHVPEELKRQIVHDVPLWSELVRMEAEQLRYPYIDMGKDFDQGLQEAHSLLIGSG